MSRRTNTTKLLWVLVAVPALVQLAWLLWAMLQRWSYPYDLEWMEGGMLNHALRIADGSGIYVAPSLDFIPFLYTPLYPGLLALLHPLTGISYQVGRAISILSVLSAIGLCYVAIVPRVARVHRAAAAAGATIAVGFYAATYPWVDGWYDLVRGDSLFLAMVVGGLVATNAWAKSGAGARGQARIAAAAGLLALAFFCKQTGVLFVAAGGGIVLVKNWRRLPMFVAVSGAVGLGGTWMLNLVSGGWFWTYTFEVHQSHDCNSDRFWDSFGQMLGRFPLMTATIAAGLIAVAVASAVRRRLPRSTEPLLVWSWVFAVALLVGAGGIATQWSHRNAFVPAMLTGAIAAGAAIPALLSSLTELVGARGYCNQHDDASSRWRFVAPGLTMALTAAMALNLVVFESWSPSTYVPTKRDRAAGDALVNELRAVDGEVFVPFHPWYAHLADKRVYTHRMGVKDVRYRPPAKRPERECFFAHPEGRSNWQVAGIPEAFKNGYFAEIVWDNRDKQYFNGLTRYYRLDDRIPRSMQPRIFSGSKNLVPTELWVPAIKHPPPAGARVIMDFERGTYDGWTRTGKAWGDRPARGPLRAEKQGPVRRYGGRYFATSMHGGDDSYGVLTSPPFLLTGERLTFGMSGGVENKALEAVDRDVAAQLGNEPWLRVELHVDGRLVRHAVNGASAGKQDSATSTPATERMHQVQWRLPEYVGQTARIVVLDRAKGAWSHINVDEFLLWEKVDAEP